MTVGCVTEGAKIGWGGTGVAEGPRVRADDGLLVSRRTDLYPTLILRCAPLPAARLEGLQAQVPTVLEAAANGVCA